ncbi:NADP-dependent oxidoreductase [Actinomycetospora soli]|uniref:NADP-dependent oxidoreductase n=1 Tax=Actinomycetospora soli TaxID=2893887 RepID=UPI001E46F979|nr:NADP-dependent oxidoreductase [Actinomycetospora soli]MCD2190561.1 NADP-dependent oxidoreductase [Actinomycetospora soli]
MKAVRFHEYGGPEVLRYEDVEQPEPEPGQVRVRVAATSFNPVDGGIRGGYLQGPFPVTLPHVPGIDVAGTVDALGADVDAWQVGDEIVGFLPMVEDGASAEYVLAPAGVLTAAPRAVALADAAALPEVGLTARQAVVEDAGVRAGQRVLVNGAGGAVGGYAVQLARRAGAVVVATGSPRSADRLRTLGADEVVDHTAGDVADAVTEPVDVLINLARLTPERFTALVGRVRDGGVVVNTVPASPAPVDAARDVRVVELFVRNDAAALAELVALVDRGELRVDVDRRVALPELATVHAEADAGTLRGKVVVVPA